ncbi:MAG TPA: DUF308 domain-containing protein [Dongiaceae bacterium]|jgi:uncharacterized membrane protein HdeD (DUF308 family)|nr:DUF308 domain-containing protein [Dongiaceae bacterium]
MARLFAGIWWLMVLRGVAGIVFGLFALFAPGATVLSLLLLLGIYLIVDGVFGLVSALMAGRRDERWGLLLVESLLNLLIGIVMIAEPGISLVVFMLLFAGWAIVTGGLMIGAAMNHKRDGKAWLIGGGLISVVFGIVLALAPIIGAVVLTWWLGLYALIFGVALLVFGLRLRNIAA